MKKSILFLLGLTGFVVSSVWLLQEGGHEPIITLCASLAALLTDFLWLSQGKISSETLKKKPNDELRTIAIQLQVGGITSMTKDELVAAIESAQKDKYPISYRWNTIKWLAVVGAILLIPLLNRTFPKREDIPPKFDLAWYEQTESGLRLVDPNNVHRFLDAEDILKNQICLPIHLALRNADNAPLQVVRVELHYERDAKCLHQVRQRLIRISGY